LGRGISIGLRYYDHLDGITDDFPLAFDLKSAVRKIVDYNLGEKGCGPSVYVVCEYGDFFLWCYKTDCGQLSVLIGSFAEPKEKDGSFDFAYYIRLLLNLCEDFIILSLEAEIIP
jgi:hypothetical protein